MSTQLLPTLKELADQVNTALDKWLPAESVEPARLHEAIRYAMFAGGKRVRPALAILVCRALGGDDDMVMPGACALECIHTYSLIHDDLPAMDDDDLRRGRPTVHIQYDEPTAILAGDGLQALAFELVLAHTPDETIAARLTRELAHYSGCAGMVGGQVLDMQAEQTANPTREQLEAIHLRKTAGLITAACTMGALASGCSESELESLRKYGRALGLAFQIADDILDETASAEDLGKTPGKDREAGKLTYPALVGLDAARELARDQIDTAKAELAFLGDRAEALLAIADFIIERAH
jgi:geranylgeranyl diphosphate synthase type II